MIKRRIIMGLLVLGTIGGFAMGFKSMSCHAKGRREAWKDEVAETCVRAAKNVDADERGEARPEEEDRGPRRGRHGHHHWGDR